jgi:hypothetical protein
MPPSTEADGRRHSRRSILKSCLGGGAAIGIGSIAGCSGVIGGSEGPIKIGDLSPRTGPGSPYGIPKHAAANLAVQEFNENGGILGREVELLDPDPQSDPDRTSQLARQFILEDEVDTALTFIAAGGDGHVPSNLTIDRVDSEDRADIVISQENLEEGSISTTERYGIDEDPDEALEYYTTQRVLLDPDITRSHYSYHIAYWILATFVGDGEMPEYLDAQDDDRDNWERQAG